MPSTAKKWSSKFSWRWTKPNIISLPVPTILIITFMNWQGLSLVQSHSFAVFGSTRTTVPNFTKNNLINCINERIMSSQIISAQEPLSRKTFQWNAPFVRESGQVQPALRRTTVVQFAGRIFAVFVRYRSAISSFLHPSKPAWRASSKKMSS